jgi:hypothetical protein
MSIPRSIDRTDLGGATVTLTTTTETVVLVGPNLQTPKDTSFLMWLATFAMTAGTASTAVTARIRAGSAVSGAQIGQSYVQNVSSLGLLFAGNILVTQQVQATDYQQVCLTLQQAAATGNGTVNAASLVGISW